MAWPRLCFQQSAVTTPIKYNPTGGRWLESPWNGGYRHAPSSARKLAEWWCRHESAMQTLQGVVIAWGSKRAAGRSLAPHWEQTKFRWVLCWRVRL